MHPSSLLRRGILLMIAGSCVFAANDAFSKLALAHIPPSQILALRGAMAISLLIAIMAWKRETAMLRYVVDLRVLLRTGADDATLEAAWRSAMWAKAAGHGINDPDFVQPDRPMSAIGG